MITFNAIPADQQSRLLTIDAVSNEAFWPQQSLISAFKHYESIGAYHGDELIAFILYQVVDTEAEIIHFVCHKSFQGKGNASALMKYFIKNTLKDAGVSVLHLEVRAGNESARKLYQLHEFVETGRRVAYYRNKEDAILMQKRL